MRVERWVVFCLLVFGAHADEEGGVMREIQRELEEEMRREQAEAAEILRDQEVAIAAEAAAREEEARKQAAADAQADKEARQQARNKGSFYRATNVGANAMRQSREERDSVGSANSDRASQSRVPKTSRPGGAEGEYGGRGEFGAAFGDTGRGGDSGGSFESVNQRISKERGGESGAEEEEEPEGRRMARLALSEQTRAAQHRAVVSVIKATGGSLTGGHDEEDGAYLGDHGDWYKVLGLRRGIEVGSARVKQEYRQRALAIHPDKNLDPLAPRAFDLLQRAYEVLSDPSKRSAYDRQLAKRAKVRRQRVWRGLQQSFESLQGITAYGWKHSGHRLRRSWKAVLLLLVIVL